MGKNKKSIWPGIVIVLCAAVMAFCAWKIYDILAERARGKALNQELEVYARYEAPTDGAQQKVHKPMLHVDFAALQAQNGDICGWIHFADTPIHYPVVQGADNDYYLTHTAGREVNSCGAIFMDCNNRADFGDYKTILYGHRMNNGTMFAELLHYAEQDYYMAHPYGLLATPEKTYVLQVFAAQEVADDRDYYAKAESARALQQDITLLTQNNCLQSDVTIQQTDKIVALSTCVKGDSSKRFMVLAKLVPYEQFDFETPLD